MSVHVQGTATANPLTLFTEPASPVTGTALTAGTLGSVTVGPYTNNSSVPLKITTINLSNQTNITGLIQPAAPITVAAGASTSLTFQGATAIAAGPYSFDVTLALST